MHQDNRVISLLRKIQTDRFTEWSDAMYGTVREMSRWLEGRAAGEPCV